LWDVVNAILTAAGLPPVTRSVSPALAAAAGWLCETAYQALRIRSEPPMTRFLARELATAHWFNISAARRDLGFEPKVSMAEGFARLRDWLAQSGEPS
jgi:nucleoside-diphosphate-sugar epimerase